MSFISVAIEHFRTFQKRVELPLADQGLVLVRGDNRVSQAADSNMVGKTGILHALSWCGWGKDLDGFGADDVACRFTREPCLVEIPFSTGELVRRGQRPAGAAVRDAGGKWWTTAGWAARQERGAEVVDGKEVQAKIDALFGHGWRTFCNAVVFGQEADHFMRADQADQMKMLDEIQGLDFRAALDRAKGWRDEWQAKRADAQRAVENAQARKEQALRQAQELIVARTQFRDGKATRVKNAQARWLAAAEAEQQRKQTLAAAREKAKDARRLVEKWDRLKELKAELETATQELRHAEYGRDHWRVQVEQAGQRVEALLKAGRCPTCRLEFTGKATAQVRMAFRPDVTVAQKGLREAETQVVLAAEVVQKKVAEVERHMKVLPQVNDKVIAEAITAANPSTLQLIERSWKQAEEEQVQADLSLKAEQAARWDGEAALAACEKEQAEAAAEEQAAEKLVATAEATVRAAEYWVEAFGDRGLRSLLFDSVAGFLNDRLAAHLAVLAAGEVVVEASALTALKGGGVRERLSVTASWAFGAKSYGASSSGQRRRVDLPLFLALQDLAEQRSARAFPLKAWDEPESHLDARGREIFAGWVQKEARRVGTGLFITQSEEMAGLLEPDRVWTVVLDRDGSHVSPFWSR